MSDPYNSYLQMAILVALNINLLVYMQLKFMVFIFANVISPAKIIFRQYW